MIKKAISILLLIIILISLTGCGEKELKKYQSEFIMLFDTITRIVGYAETEKEFTGYSQLIYDNLKEYHQLYDIYNDYEGVNNIKTINDNAGIKPVKADEKIIDLIKFSKELHDETKGKTNIAYGAVLTIWHEYRTEGIEDPKNAVLPPEEDLRSASLHTNIEDIIIDEENSTVFLKDPLMSLDVGAIAKGYATEQVSKTAEEKGMYSALLSVGGNVRAINNNITTNEPWNVGIQNPDSRAEKQVFEVVKLDGWSLVTSGDYERYYTVDGEKYNHIIDPATMYPARYFTAVSIICKDSGVADALSTAVFCMPFEEGLEFINSLPDTEAMWIFSDKTVRYSDNFESFIKR